MAYAREVALEVTGVDMTKRLTQIEAVLNGIEEMKRRIVLTSSNETMPYAIKTQKLDDMRAALLSAEHYALELMRVEISELKATDCGDGDGHDKG
jgi:hypothetical protein